MEAKCPFCNLPKGRIWFDSKHSLALLGGYPPRSAAGSALTRLRSFSLSAISTCSPHPKPRCSVPFAVPAMVGPLGQPTVYCCQFPHPFGGGPTGLKRPPAAPNPRNLYAHENTVPLTGDYLQRRAHIPSPG